MREGAAFREGGWVVHPAVIHPETPSGQVLLLSHVVVQVLTIKHGAVVALVGAVLEESVKDATVALQPF